MSMQYVSIAQNYSHFLKNMFYIPYSPNINYPFDTKRILIFSSRSN